MSLLHVKSTGGNVAPFATWANAGTTLAGAIASMAAGDTLYIDSTHSEVGAGVNITVPGTTAAVSKLLGGTPGSPSGITALGSGAVIESNNATYVIAGNFYASNITFKASSVPTVTPTFAGTSGNVQHFNACTFEMSGGTSTSQFKFGTPTGGVSTYAILKDCLLKYSNTAQLVSFDCNVAVQGGGLAAGGSAVTGLFKLAHNSRGIRTTIDDFDASGAATSVNVLASIGSGGASAKIRRMKLPVGWTGGLVATGYVRAGDRYEMTDYSYGTVNKRMWIADYAGVIKDNDVVKVTANSYSLQVATTADCGLINPLRSHEYFVELNSGSAQSLTLDVLTDNVTLNDNEMWLEVDYYAGTTNVGTIVNDGITVIQTPAAQATSTTVWTTTGITTPVKQKVSVSITPGQAGFAIARLIIAKPSTTVYVDDRIVVA